MSIARIEISRERMLHNLRQLRGLYPEAGAVAVVKGNAYGHGLKEVSRILEDHVEAFQVDDLDELRQLREKSEKRVLVLGYVPSADLEEAISLGGELALYDTERLDAIEAAAGTVGKSADVHIKIDTLLGRQGILPSDLAAFLEALDGKKGIEVAGVYTHFANIEDTTDFAHGQAQVDLFEEAVRVVRARYPGAKRHISSTSGLLAYEQKARRNDLVRLGIGLYGLYPSEALERSFASLDLRPVLRWTTMLAQAKTLPPGHPVGYGLTFVTWKETRIGIVPQGYADGYDRGLSNASHVLVGGKRCPVIGRIAMNMFAVDLTSVPEAKAEDEVVLLGEQGDQRISAEEMGRRIGTINYEVVARISPLLPRVVV